MRTKVIFLAFIVSLAFGSALNAQGFGAHPSDVKWQEINTQNVRVVFPKGLDKRAFRIADIINYINQNNTYSVGDKSKKLDLVLQTNQVMSNGFVTLAPYRSEFYTTGFQDNTYLGAIDWLDVLSVHEYRHALQFVNGRRGFTKFLYYLTGESGWNLGLNLAIPNWYFEGDAVNTETVLSNSGRGRMPAFFRGLKANLLNDREYSYMTSRNGSFKNLIPNHYPLGYTMVHYVRNKYGATIWKNILADAGSYRSVIYPFGGAVRRQTGKSVRQIYKEAYNELKQEFKDELSTVVLRPTQTITPKAKRTVTNYEFPQLLSDGSIVAIKNSFAEIKHLVRIKDGKEAVLCDYGIAPIPFLSEKNGKVAWVEVQQDPRRGNRNYTRVVSYDMNTKQKSYIVSKTKYFSPEFSANGKQIIVVKADENMQNKLVIIDDKGNIVKELHNPTNDFLSFPKWANNDSEIVFVAKRNSQLAIQKYNLKTQKIENMTAWSGHTIGGIDVVKDHVYFSASYSGIDNIYSVNINGDKKLEKISSVPIGAYEPAVSQNGKELVMVEPTDMGMVLTKMSLDEVSDNNFTYKEPFEMSQFNIQTNEKEQNIFDKIEAKTYTVKPYKGFLKGIKLYDWGIAAGDDAGLSLTFGNILTDIKATVGANYNKNEEKMNYSGELLYGKWWVQMGLKYEKLRRDVDYFNATSILSSEIFDENNFAASMSVPLNWNKGSFLFAFNPEVDFIYHKTSNYKNSSIGKDYLNFGSVKSKIVFSAKQMQAVQNIYPHYGVVFNAQYQKSLKKEVRAEQIKLQGAVYLPGVLKNHGFKLDASWKRELSGNNFKFLDEFVYARGYAQIPNDKALKVSVNYALPLFYPDWGGGGITYFKRIRANLFYDMGKLTYENTTIDQNSYGVELLFDNTIFNLAPFTFGLRESFLKNEDLLNSKRKNKLEVFLRVDF